jgi:Flp pilus assembly protein TadG
MPVQPQVRSATLCPRRGQLRPAPTGGTGRSARRDRGAATLELVVLFPVLMLLIFGVVQGALFFHGRNVALAAAEQGVRAGRAEGLGDPAAVAAAQARQFLLDTGELDNLTNLVIAPAVDGDQVRVTITARTVSLLPGVPGPRVSHSAAGSLERFTTGGAP